MRVYMISLFTAKKDLLRKTHLPAMTAIVFTTIFLLSACTKNSDNTSQQQQLLALTMTTTYFTDNHNGTVNDGVGKMWAKCAYGQTYDSALNTCTGSGGGTTYNAMSVIWCDLEAGCQEGGTLVASSGPAFTACSDYTAGGYTDWRLPTKEEYTLVTSNIQYDVYAAMFPQTPDDKSFWTGSTNIGDMSYKTAIGINISKTTFGEQRSYNKKYGYLYIRCIRP
jgi:hypothetical protein